MIKIKHSHRWKDLTGLKFGRLIVIKFKEKGPNNQSIWECLCDCGKETTVRTGSLMSRRIVSCGCYRLEQVWKSNSKDISGKRYGKLIAVCWTGEVKGHNGRVWKCQCDCGGTRDVPISKLTQGRTLRCKGCSGFINGVRASSQQRQIAKMFPGSVLNYKEGKKFIDIALVDEKIALEYDGWYWHRKQQDKDAQRVKDLVARGWKVLTIKSSSQVPSKELVVSALRLLDNVDTVTLQLEDWG